jgi:Tfp pilus assembly protein FimT
VSIRQNAKQRGQGMTEYIIIVALIALAAIAAYSFFGQTVRNQVAGMAEELSGNSAAAGTAITAAQGTAAQATGEGNQTRGLNNYNSGTAIGGGGTGN